MSFLLRLGGFAFRGRGRRSLSCEPFFLQTLTVVRECLLRDLVLSHCLPGVNWTKCLTRIALGFGGRFCHFFTFSPSSTSRRMASGYLSWRCARSVVAFDWGACVADDGSRRNDCRAYRFRAGKRCLGRSHCLSQGPNLGHSILQIGRLFQKNAGSYFAQPFHGTPLTPRDTDLRLTFLGRDRLDASSHMTEKYLTDPRSASAGANTRPVR